MKEVDKQVWQTYVYSRNETDLYHQEISVVKSVQSALNIQSVTAPKFDLFCTVSWLNRQ